MTQRCRVLALVTVACQLLVASAVGAQGAPATDPGDDAAQAATHLALGERIYRDGVGATGQPLTARGAAQMTLAGKDAACATCHRRSGYGTSEGKFVIRPIIGPALLQEQTVPVHAPRVKARVGVSHRPPYSEALLARAIRNGIDAAGKPFDAVMPRYALSDVEMKALSSYLFSLGAKPSPGVDEHDIHFATVIQPGVSVERKRAMLDVMRAFVKDKGANVRMDEQRREAGNMRMYRSYRRWVLHVWELSGPSETWSAQLDAYYRQQPVFALIGGLGDAGWGPIHAFSERLAIPSVFPQVHLPELTGTNHFTFYFSRGVVLEAEVLAKFMREQGDASSIVQVYRRDGAGSVAAAAFRAALTAGATVDDRVLDGAPSEAFWRQLYASKPGALVLWLGAADMAGARPTGGATPATFLSSNLLSGRIPDALANVDVRLISASDLPPKRDARLLRNKLWMHNKGIAVSDEMVQVNTQFTMTVVSDVVGHMQDSFSRDFFVERLEHAVGQTPMASIYQSVSLGPGQRYAAKGSLVVQLIDPEKKQWKALSDWIVP